MITVWSLTVCSCLIAFCLRNYFTNRLVLFHCHFIVPAQKVPLDLQVGNLFDTSTDKSMIFEFSIFQIFKKTFRGLERCSYSTLTQKLGIKTTLCFKLLVVAIAVVRLTAQSTSTVELEEIVLN